MGKNNVHEDCEHYVSMNDMCLLFFQFGFHNVSQYKECLEKKIYPYENQIIHFFHFKIDLYHCPIQFIQ